MTLIILFLEIKKEDNWKKNLSIGIIAGLAITIKQTTGLIILISVVGWKILDIKNKKDFKKYIKSALIRLFGGIICVLTFFIILIRLGAFNDYIDYCILGVSTFSNKISYMDGLIKNSSILIRVLSMVPICVYVALIVIYIKLKKKEALVLLVYSISLMILVYPISDEAHFVVAIPATLISIGYLLELLAEKIKVPKKEEIISNNFLESAIVLFAIFYFFNGMITFHYLNKNTELNHFKYLPMDKDGISGVKEVEEFIQSQEKEVYILDATAALYIIPIDKYHKNYDMFNKGNLGAKGEEGQIENLKKLDNKIILIRNKNYGRNWQNPEEVRKYVIDEMNKTGEIGIFDIYE